MLNNDTYFSQENSRKYMSVSQFKSFMDCESRTMAELKGEYHRGTTEALLVGSYVDAWFEGTLEKFTKANSSEIYTRSGTLKKPYQHAEYIIERVQRDKKFMQYMSGEKQQIFTGEIAGVPFKIKVDSYHKNLLVDLKVMRDFNMIYDPVAHRKLHFIDAWRYDIQGAVYREIVRQNTGQTLKFYIAAVTKEAEPDLEIFWIEDDVLDAALDEVKALAPRFQKIKNGEIEPTKCGKCFDCRKKKILQNPINYREVYDFDAEDFDG